MFLQFTEKRPVRVVFDVTLEGSARKVITVRSALMVHNSLEDPIDIKLENPAQTPGGITITHSLCRIMFKLYSHSHACSLYTK